MIQFACLTHKGLCTLHRRTLHRRYKCGPLDLQAQQRTSSFPGLLLEASSLSERLSVAMLFGRLLIAVLFLYVGLHELHRLLFEVCIS